MSRRFSTPTSPDLALRRNARIFAGLEHHVERQVELAQWRKAAAYAQIASEFASQCHPGRFVSLPLERSLTTVADAFGLGVPGGTQRRGSISSVLHVMTKTVVPGGHTNWVRRWIEQDGSRNHSLIIVDQASEPVPRDLRSAVERSGGTLRSLTSARGDMIEAARILGAAAHDYDAVVLSTHPRDVVPSLAFSRRADRPPVIRLNHADHRFWIGCAVSDVLVEIRPVGARFSRLRRGFPEQRQLLAPVPIDVPQLLDRDDARRIVGVGDDDFLVVTVGAPYKFRARGEPGFLDLIVPVLRALPHLVVIVVGPTASRAWQTRSAGLSNRLRPVGPKGDLAPFLSAADAYLNSTPIGSDTATWEAAAAGLPILTMRPRFEELGLIATDPDEFGDAALQPATDEELIVALSLLQDDPDRLHQLAQAARQLAVDERSLPAWSENLRLVYDKALAAEPIRLSEVVPDDLPSRVDAELSKLASASPVRTLAVAAARVRQLLPGPQRAILASAVALGDRRRLPDRS